MKLVSFQREGRTSFGCLLEDVIVDLQSLAVRENDPPALETFEDLDAVIQAGPAAVESLRRLLAKYHDAAERLTEFAYGLDECRLLAPLRRADKIIAIGRNYEGQKAIGSGSEPPAYPRIFPKWNATIVGPGDPIVRPPHTTELDWEVELAVVIGRQATFVDERDALDYVAGYTLINDVTARDLQFSKPEQLTLAKNFRSFTPMGSWIVTKDAVADPGQLSVRLYRNGVLRQDSTHEKLIYSIARLVSFLSEVVDLYPGDLISTGTPDGVGFTSTPPAYLVPGDHLRLELFSGPELICELENDVVDAARA